MKTRMQIRISAAKRTLLGRTLCRLAGDQGGAVMMEYVILGVMVAAAAVLGVKMFGKQIVSSLGIMTEATAGKNGAAEKRATDAQTAATTDADAAESSRGTISGGK